MSITKNDLATLHSVLTGLTTHSGSKLQTGYATDEFKVGAIVENSDSKVIYTVVNITVDAEDHVRLWLVRIDKDGNPTESTVGFLYPDDVNLLAPTLESFKSGVFEKVDVIKALDLLRDGKDVFIEYHRDKERLSRFSSFEDFDIYDIDDLLLSEFYITKE